MLGQHAEDPVGALAAEHQGGEAARPQEGPAQGGPALVVQRPGQPGLPGWVNWVSLFFLFFYFKASFFPLRQTIRVAGKSLDRITYVISFSYKCLFACLKKIITRALRPTSYLNQDGMCRFYTQKIYMV